MSMNPRAQLSARAKVEHTIARHTELVIFILGLVIGFAFGKF